jgi:hypothetical protein
MVITWLFKLGDLLRYVREGAVIARRGRIEELRRYLSR